MGFIKTNKEDNKQESEINSERAALSSISKQEWQGMVSKVGSYNEQILCQQSQVDSNTEMDTHQKYLDSYAAVTVGKDSCSTGHCVPQPSGLWQLVRQNSYV